MHETLTLQVGQCGNQVGNEFWRKIIGEHGIGLDGVAECPELEGRRDRFFYETDGGRFVPRAVLVDLEPRVVSQALPCFNPDSIFIANEGSGAGNNWAHGYYAGTKARADILDLIQREAEACDAIEAIWLVHSVAGGTGSGFGSLLADELRTAFPKQVLSAFSVLPVNDEASDVVVQPYNSVLSLAHLKQSCSSVTIMDNQALGRVAVEAARTRAPGFAFANSLAASVLSASSATLRFPAYSFCDSHSLLYATVPVPSLPFLVPSYAPFCPGPILGPARRTTAQDILRRLLVPKTRLCTYASSQSHASVALLSILSGECSPTEVCRATATIHQEKPVSFVPWMPRFCQTAISRKPEEHCKVSGLALNNTTATSALLKKICLQFDQLKNRGAFIEMYRKFDATIDVFNSCREVVQGLVDSYESAELPEYSQNIEGRI